MMFGQGLVRNSDGVLVWRGGHHYSEPDEAIFTPYAGKYRLGCTAAVYNHYSTSPCGNAAKHDPDAHGRPTKCGIHCADAVAKRKEKSEAKYAAHRAKWKRQREQAELSRELMGIVRRIADGHNDPRGLALDWVMRWDETK